MNARQFLTHAQALASDASLGPAEYRSSVSRAYYGAFLVAQAFLRDHVKLEPSNHGDRHGAIKLALLECKDDNLRIVGMKLDFLHTERKAADYDMDKVKPEKQENAVVACMEAAKIIGALDTLLSAPELGVLVAQIRAWAATPAGRNRLRPC